MFGIILKKAIFRGISFDVQVIEGKLENNLVAHDYIGKDKPFIEPMGVKGRVFPLIAFLNGKDHLFKKDLLLEAAKKQSAGKLIHPTDGILNVYPKIISYHHSNSSLNTTKLNIEFIETSDDIYPQTKIDELAIFMSKVDKFINNSTLEFLAVFDVLNTTSYVLQSASGIVGKISDFITSSSGLGIFASSYSEGSRAIESLKENKNSLIKSPNVLAETLLTALGAKDSTSFERRKVLTLTKIGSVFTKFPLSDELSQSEKKAVINSNSLIQLVYNYSIGIAVKFILLLLEKEIKPSDNSFNSLSRTDLIKIIHKTESQLSKSISEADDESYRIYYDFKSILLDIIGQSSRFPEVKTLELNQSEPSILLMYRQYGHLDFESDFISRNEIKDPCFVSESKSYEVLNV